MKSIVSGQELMKSLYDEIEATDPEMLAPWEDTKSPVLGTVEDPFTRKVFSLSAFYRREAKRIQVDAEASGEELKLNDTYNLYKQKHETLHEIMWLLIRSQLGAWSCCVGVRKNWQVVNCDNEKENNLPDFLKRLLKD